MICSNIWSMQSYNSQYGLSEGDALIRLVASTLEEQFPGALLVRGADGRRDAADAGGEGALTGTAAGAMISVSGDSRRPKRPDSETCDFLRSAERHRSSAEL